MGVGKGEVSVVGGFLDSGFRRNDGVGAGMTGWGRRLE